MKPKTKRDTRKDDRSYGHEEIHTSKKFEPSQSAPFFLRALAKFIDRYLADIRNS